MVQYRGFYVYHRSYYPMVPRNRCGGTHGRCGVVVRGDVAVAIKGCLGTLEHVDPTWSWTDLGRVRFLEDAVSRFVITKTHDKYRISLLFLTRQHTVHITRGGNISHPLGWGPKVDFSRQLGRVQTPSDACVYILWTETWSRRDVSKATCLPTTMYLNPLRTAAPFFGDKLLEIWVACPLNGTAVLKGVM